MFIDYITFTFITGWRIVFSHEIVWDIALMIIYQDRFKAGQDKETSLWTLMMVCTTLFCRILHERELDAVNSFWDDLRGLTPNQAYVVDGKTWKF